MKHSSSIDAKILANINKGEVDEFSTQAGGGFLGKIFDMSNKQRAADRVSRATLGEKMACAAICVFKLQSAFLVLLSIERNPGKFPANFLVIGDSPLLKPQKQCTIGLKERQEWSNPLYGPKYVFTLKVRWYRHPAQKIVSDSCASPLSLNIFEWRQQLGRGESGFCFRSVTTKDRFPRKGRRGLRNPATLINANFDVPIGSLCSKTREVHVLKLTNTQVFFSRRPFKYPVDSSEIQISSAKSPNRLMQIRREGGQAEAEKIFISCVAHSLGRLFERNKVVYT